jgi:hypothetical protein
MIIVLVSDYCELNFSDNFKGITTARVDLINNSLLKRISKAEMYSRMEITMTETSPDICIASTPHHIVNSLHDRSYYDNINMEQSIVVHSDSVFLNMLKPQIIITTREDLRNYYNFDYYVCLNKGRFNPYPPLKPDLYYYINNERVDVGLTRDRVNTSRHFNVLISELIKKLISHV